MHVLVVGSGSVLLIGGDVDLVTSADGDIVVVGGVTSTDLGTFLRVGQYVDA